MNIIGLDLGTTTLSAVLVDSDSGAMPKVMNIPNGAALPGTQRFERLQDPEVIATKALGLVDTLKREYDVAAIGLDGQMHGIVYVDGEGRAVSPLYTWQDQRGEEPLGDTTFAGALTRRAGRPVATGYGLVTHFWNALNGKVPEGATKLCTIYDYIGMRLTGRRAPLVHVSSAASLGLADPATGQWDAEEIRRAGMDPAILPEVTDSFEIIGSTPDGIPVCCGLGDNQTSFIGALREMEGSLLINMGTGGQVSMLAANAATAGELEARPMGGGRSILVGSMLCGGRAYALLEGFLRSCAALAGDEEKPLYEAMNRLGLELLDDDRLPDVDTRFSGTRARPGLRGAITGIGIDNFDAGRLVAGTLMGMARELRGLYGEMLAAGNAPAVRLVGSGNGIRKNPALRRAVEKVFGLKLLIPRLGEEAAFGAALAAMAAAGIKPSLAAAQGLIQYD